MVTRDLLWNDLRSAVCANDSLIRHVPNGDLATRNELSIAICIEAVAPVVDNESSILPSEIPIEK